MSPSSRGSHAEFRAAERLAIKKRRARRVLLSPPPLPTRNIFRAFPDAIDGGCSSLGTFQARWRGVSLRRRLAAALAAVTWPDLEEEEEELLEELDPDGFTFDEVCARTHDFTCVVQTTL